MKQLEKIILICFWIGLCQAIRADDLSEFYQDNFWYNFRNIALHSEGSTAFITQKNNEKISANQLIDGDVSHLTKFSDLPSSITIQFPDPIDLEAIRIFSGNPENAANASGECGIRSCRIRIEQDGKWHDAMGGAQIFPSFREMKAKGPYTYHALLTPKQKEVTAVEIEILSSTDTGRRMDTEEEVAVANRVCYVREIEIFSSEKLSHPQPMPVKAILDGDFKLPVYTDEHIAELVLQPKKWVEDAESFRVALFDESGKTEIGVMENLECPPDAQTSVRMPIDRLKNGIYRAEIGRADGQGKTMTRWLRIQHPITPPSPTEPVSVSHVRKILFLDSYYLEEWNGFSFMKQKAEALEILRKNVEPGYILNRGTAFFRGTDGKFYFRFESMPREAQSIIGYVHEKAEKKSYTAVSEDLISWTISPGILGTPSPRNTKFASIRSPHVSWKNVQTCRIYDADKDSPIPLDQIKLVFSGYDDTVWGNKKIPARSIYPVWQKSPSELVLLQPKPLMQMGVSTSDEIPGKWSDINDNWGGQWLDADGKTLYYLVAAMVPRRSPFIIPYDNVTNAERLFVLWKTTDGKNWTHKYVSPPQNTDPKGWQHYGINHGAYRDTEVRIGFLFAYDSWRQQIYADILYTYDNENWYRPDPETRFADNGKIGSWNFGSMFVSPDQAVEKDGYCYAPVLTAYSLPHFAPTWVFRKEKQDASLFESLFGQKNIEDWPYWKEMGGNFEGMAAKLKVDPDFPYRTFGLLKYRMDGFVAMSAGDTEGEATTCLLNGISKTVSLNARTTTKDGFLKIEILHADGTPLPDYSGENAAQFSGDKIDAPVQWKAGTLTTPPAQGDYRIKFTGKNVEIFSLSFQ